MEPGLIGLHNHSPATWPVAVEGVWLLSSSASPSPLRKHCDKRHSWLTEIECPDNRLISTEILQSSSSAPPTPRGPTSYSAQPLTSKLSKQTLNSASALLTRLIAACADCQCSSDKYRTAENLDVEIGPIREPTEPAWRHLGINPTFDLPRCLLCLHLLHPQHLTQ